MPVSSNLNLSLPATPLADDPKLNGELQLIYNAFHILVQTLNDSGIPSGGSSPVADILDIAHGGTGTNIPGNVDAQYVLLGRIFGE
jgi:hypothetical protein